MPTKLQKCLLFVLFWSVVWSTPLNHDLDRSPLTVVSDITSAVSDLNSRVASHASRLQQGERDPRLPLPTPQDLDTIKKVAQILIMLGEQVIPAITGESPSSPPNICDPPEIPNDPVNDE